MSVLALVEAACREQMAEIAEKICDDYKSSVNAKIKHKAQSSGQAVGSIHIEQTGDTSYRIGGSHLHLWYFEMGNGSGLIYPKQAKALRFKDGSFQGSASTYPGNKVYVDVAKRWNG